MFIIKYSFELLNCIDQFTRLCLRNEALAQWVSSTSEEGMITSEKTGHAPYVRHGVGATLRHRQEIRCWGKCPGVE